MTRDYHVFRRRHTSSQRISFAGSVHPAVLFSLFSLFVTGAGYLYALNRGAVQGYETRTLEREISELKKENGKLKLSEAEVLSLAAIEAAAREREMSPIVTARTLEEKGTLAARSRR